jgi:hypothetical protein
MSVISIGNSLTGPDLVVAFGSERESIRRRKEAGEPAPWTFDPVLQKGSFTNVQREDDKTTRFYAANIRERYKDRAELLAATPAFLWFNLIRTGQTFTCTGDDGLCALDRMFTSNSVEPLREALKTQERPYTNGAYRLTPPREMLGRLDKIEGCLYTLQRFLDQSGWRRCWPRWQTSKPPLAEVGAWYKDRYNFGTFQAGQNVACLKYAEPFRSAPDWWTWAYSGDGSRMGLNIVLGRPIDARWPVESAWQWALRETREKVMPRMVAAGVPELHAQDFQNVLCETSKLWRVANDSGRLKSNHTPTGPVLTGSALAVRLDELRADAIARFAAGGIKSLDWLSGKIAAE